jgi:hypothetical protein
MVDEDKTNLFNFTLRDSAYDWCNNYMRDLPNYRFGDLQQIFYKCY